MSAIFNRKTMAFSKVNKLSLDAAISVAIH